jgi:hypothetical protein
MLENEVRPPTAFRDWTETLDNQITVPAHSPSPQGLAL